jgi:hypothetical protein
VHPDQTFERPSKTGYKPLGSCPQKELFMKEHTATPSNLNEINHVKQLEYVNQDLL